MDESTILVKLTTAAAPLNLPVPLSWEDLGDDLTPNPTHRWKKRDVKAIKGLVWHQELGWGSVEAVHKYHSGENSHLNPGGVESISYTWAIRRSGQIILCNDFNAKTWSQGDRSRAGDENAEFMSVMMEGMFKGPHVTDSSAGEPTQEQLLAGLILWRVCAMEWGWDQDGLYPHSMFGKPSCPGYTAQEVIEAFRRCPVEAIATPPPLKYNLSTTEGRQSALIYFGFLKGKADGVWGPQSKGALVAFQSASDLISDGVWGRNTERAMLAKLEST